jgi:hypothetical protein
MSKLLEVVAAGLRAGGFDGLVTPGECGCLAADMAPGGCLNEGCEPGYKHTHSQRPGDWIISLTKDGVSDDDIDRCIAECC